MNSHETETSVVPHGEAVAIRERSPAQVLADAQDRAKLVAGVIRDRKLFARVGHKDYVQVEGWTTLAAQYNLVPSVAWSRPLESGGFEAQAELRRMDSGAVVATAQAECGTANDGEWIDRAAYAQRSMAETRAVSKVCRIALSWVMVLGGYEATPAEEVPREGFPDRGSPNHERLIPLRFAGDCTECGYRIAAGTKALYNFSAKSARHAEGECPSEPAYNHPDQQPDAEPPPKISQAQIAGIRALLRGLGGEEQQRAVMATIDPRTIDASGVITLGALSKDDASKILDALKKPR